MKALFVIALLLLSAMIAAALPGNQVSADDVVQPGYVLMRGK